ncbi:cobalt-precorrin-6A reductase [Sulfitobacter sp. F26169L]|uniref:cobalt-precorrin-6A reductase n=1 Tax=Sulfitobacter sp. F26169L TaxID=2996015 RepID=UPI002260F13C|nr:cobalt-precorrin-6A reductase [Sulfitobacter sp. F26169L]MCX7567113.1 cobalt-precorrin-6A reductase [Sulfitobacter sp. F26169L]
MEPNLLVLGGTTESSALCRALSEAGIRATVSLAGRVARPIRQPLPQRVGGFGGVAGLTAYLKAHAITHVVDATHPFAAQMSTNAVAACTQTGVPLIALTRSPWSADKGDNWATVPDIAGAVAALDRPAARVMLAVGRMHLAQFAPNRQHLYLLRLIDAPDAPLPFLNCNTVLDRGPFTIEGDLALMQEHRIDLVVSKNSGGGGAYAKIAAARQLALPVIMIDRPAIPARPVAHTIPEILNWIAHCGTERGV